MQVEHRWNAERWRQTEVRGEPPCQAIHGKCHANCGMKSPNIRGRHSCRASLYGKRWIEDNAWTGTHSIRIYLFVTLKLALILRKICLYFYGRFICMAVSIPF
jgi:hypothetical protein